MHALVIIQMCVSPAHVEVCECPTHVGNGVEEGEVGSPHARVTDAIEEAAHGCEHQCGGEGGQQAAHC